MKLIIIYIFFIICFFLFSNVLQLESDLEELRRKSSEKEKSIASEYEEM